MRFSVLVAAVCVCAATAVAPARAQGGAAHAAIDTTITVRARTSTLEFDPPAIAAKHGTRVRIRFSNMGTLPHNFVVVRDDNDIDDLAAAAAKLSGDVPIALKAKMIAYSTLASPGQTVEVTFIMPPPGEYTYVCLMTGHSNSMLGKLRSLR
ncbi:MAG: plastocyanin/azurin family copper-binding protein [bacterium]